MNILDIIDKKENKQILSKEELQYVIDNYLNGNIEDYQMSAFLTEIDLLGLSLEETIDLTDIMLNSGEKLNFGPNVADKHSTGGVGDKTTLVLLPLVASLGVKVAKMSGRGLGHTGGTIDKLESIKNFQTTMSLDEFTKQVNEINVALASQMGNLVPADKKIYALRDVSGTVDSIPLIASSIMSKKLASGADTIVIDLKVGSGALVNNLSEAKKLAKTMVTIGKNYNKKVICVLTNMDEPLGYAVGNSIEVLEAIDTLKDNGPEDLKELVLELSSYMVSNTLNISKEEAYNKSLENLSNGLAYQKFTEWVRYQKGDLTNIVMSKNVKQIKMPINGYIKNINALEIGKLSRKLGAGRLTKNDVIDLSVGLKLNCKVGDYLNKGDDLITIYYNDKLITEEEVLSCFEFSLEKVEKPKLIIEVIS